MTHAINIRIDGIEDRQAHHILEQLNEIKELIMATREDANTKLDTINGKMDKISAETTGLVTEIRQLKEAAQNAGVPDEVMQKIDSLASKADSIDSQVDDVAPNPTPTPEEGGGTTA